MPRTPKPFTHVRGSTTGKPIMALLDVLGRRWTLRILWELKPGRLTFRALQEKCGGPSPTVLNARLKDLRETALVDLVEGDGYGLTRLGEELGEQLLPLVRWSERWAKTLR